MFSVQFCHNCGGSGKVKCPLCGGKGTQTKRGGIFDGFTREKIECSHCHGTGEVLCEVCKGMGRSGSVGNSLQSDSGLLKSTLTSVLKSEPSITRVQICQGCGGTGKIKCPLCKGKGTLKKRSSGLASMLQPIEPPKSGASGSGVIWPDDRIECTACNGTGEILCKICGGVGKIAISE